MTLNLAINKVFTQYQGHTFVLIMVCSITIFKIFFKTSIHAKNASFHHAYNISAGFYSVCVVYLNESPVYVSFKEEESDTSRARIEDLCLWLYHCIKTKRNDHIVKKYCK